MTAKAPLVFIFKSLKGSWRLRRSLDSALPGFPSGIFEGQAIFTPRKPLADSVTAELLYSEKGELKTGNGLVLKAHRKYIYRYTAEEDKISVWFVTEDSKDDDGEEVVDYLFHDLEFEHNQNGWAGRGEHLCEKDMYWSYHEFRLPKIISEGTQMELFGAR